MAAYDQSPEIASQAREPYYHVVHVIDALRPGGAEYELVEIVRRLDPSKFHTTIVSLYGDASFGLDLEGPSVSIVSLGLRSRQDLVRGLAKLTRLIKKLHPDLIHTWLYDADQLGRLAARVCGIRQCVSALQSSWWEPDSLKASHIQTWKSWILRCIEMLTGRLARARYVACSTHVAESNVKRLKLDRFRVKTIYNGVDPEKFSFAPSGFTAAGEDSGSKPTHYPVLISVARLVPPKGQRLLLEALPSIIERFPTTKLLLVGIGPQEDELHRESDRLMLGEHVEFLGRRSDVNTLLQKSDIFLWPTVAAEGFGLALAEAMLCGCVPVGWNLGPNPELVEHNSSGLLLKPFDVNSFSAAVCQLASDPVKRSEMALAAHNRAVDRFDITSTAAQFQDYYLTLLSGKFLPA